MNAIIRSARLTSTVILLLFLTSTPVFGQAKQAEEKPTDSSDKTEFVRISEFIPSAVLDFRYFGDHNFIGERIRGYLAEEIYLTRVAAVALAKVQEELLTMSLSLKIYDAYRPQQAVDQFVEWGKNLEDTAMRVEFYPEVEKQHLFRDGYISARSGHSRGSTLDLTIVSSAPEEEPQFNRNKMVDCRLGVSERFADNSLDMGTGYDCLDTMSWTNDDRIGKEQRANRHLLKVLMEKYGFQNYEREWWHYTFVNEPFPDTYFDFPVE